MMKNQYSKDQFYQDDFQSNNLSKYIALLLLILSSVFILSCQPPVEEEREIPFGERSANITPVPEEKLTEFEAELKSMRTADFYYIFTLKRKDGGAFTTEDKEFVRANKHYATNRFSFIEKDTVLFIGTNYKFSDENIAALTERFEFQNFSKPEDQIEKEKAAKKAEREKQKDESENSETDSKDASENSAN
jgi:hypothetical protein